MSHSVAYYSEINFRKLYSLNFNQSILKFGLMADRLRYFVLGHLMFTSARVVYVN